MNFSKHFARLLILMLFACGCAPTAAESAGLAAPTPSAGSPTAALPLLQPTATAAVTSTPTELPSPTATAAASAPYICSPLAEVALPEIPGLVSNPYHPPKPGYDDPHTGVDLALRVPGSQAAVAGRTVLSAFSGRVAMVTRDRFPFGNAVIIETPLDALPEGWIEQAAVPTPAPTPAARSALTCPAAPVLPAADPSRRSLYVLYAHLLEPPAQNLGDTLGCGENLGAVGRTGNALNPHLHFEIRVGPSGIQLPQMAHYDASATAEEMASYCLWTVSGIFQLTDPLSVLAAQGAQP